MQRLWTKEFVSLTAAMVFLGTGFYMLLPTLPMYIQELGGSEAQVGLVAGIFTLTAVVFRLIVGGLLDRYGRRIFLLLGLLVFAVCVYLYNWVGGIAVLLALRMVHGASWAVCTTSIGTTVTDVIPESRRGEGMGWFGMSMTIAMALGPMLGTRVMQSQSFHDVFLIAAALSAFALAMAFATRVPFQSGAGARRVDFVEKPLIPLMLALLLLTVSYGGITAFIPLWSETISVNPGLYFLVFAIMITAVRPVAGKMADRYGEAAVILPSLAVVTVALIILCLFQDIFGIVASAVLYGIGFGAAQPAFQAMALRLARPDRKGVANASVFTAFDLGISIGSIALGWIFPYTGYPGMFAVSALAVAGSLVLFGVFARKRMKQRQPEEPSVS